MDEPETRRLPLFPLGTPMLPGAELELHVFEPRYRRFVSLLLELPPEQRLFGIIALRGTREVGDDVAEDLAAFHSVGCAARLEVADELSDGRFDVTARTTTRFRLHAVTPGDGEPVDGRAGPRWTLGQVSWLDEVTTSEADELAVPVAQLLARYVAALPGSIAAGLDLPEAGVALDPLGVSYAVSRAVVLPVQERQALLEAADAATRLRMARRVLRRELALITGGLPSLPVARADLITEPTSSN